MRRRSLESGGSQLKRGSSVCRATDGRHSIELAVARLKQAAGRIAAIRTTGKRIEDGVRPLRCHSEHRPLIARASVGGHSVEITIVALDETAGRVAAIRAPNE